MINSTITHYRITAKLGQGGMGEVYRATDTKLDRDVAIKILPGEISQDADRRKRFIKEAKAASSLNHPHVCTIYEVSETADGQPFIAMEFLPGQTLADFAGGKPLDNEKIVAIGTQIADALDAAHSAGIVHRDIKPENIHIDSQGRVKVLDFGLAKIAHTRPVSEISTAEMTEPGKLMGTPDYMSPEQARSQEVDHRSDLFSVGIVLYELTTGRLPFSGSGLVETMEKITGTQPEAMARFNYEITPELERIIRKCLEKNPEDRYQTARELLIDLRRLQRQSGTTTVIHPEKQRSWWGTWAATISVALLGMVLLGTWWSRQNSPPGTPQYGKSVAVIPFKVTSEDITFFADGLCEELANALGRVEQFDRIPPWSSSSSFREDAPSMKKMAEAMEVSTLLEGSLEKMGDQLRIRAALVDPFRGRSGTLIWSGTYDHNQSELPFAIQDEIARSIVEKLRLELEDDPARQFVQRYTESPEAYDCYLKGRYFWNQRGPGLEKAKKWFELALLYDSPTGSADDSQMAPAYVGLADTYNLQAFYGLIPFRAATTKARQYVDRALDIDDRLAEAYATLGWSEMNAGNAAKAEAAFERSIQLNDRYVPAHQWYSSFHNAIGNRDRSGFLARKAVELDPLSDFTKTVSAWQLSSVAPEDAIVVIDDAIAHQPDFALAHFIRGTTLLFQDQVEAAVPSCEAAVRHSGELAFYQATLALAYARSDRRSEALQALHKAQAKSSMGPTQIVTVAAAYLALGDKERCYDTLEQGLSTTGCLPWLLSRWIFLDALQTEPRFIDIVNRSGLLKYNEATQAFEVNTEPRNRERIPEL